MKLIKLPIVFTLLTLVIGVCTAKVEPEWSYHKIRGDVASVAISSDGKYIVVGSINHEVLHRITPHGESTVFIDDGEIYFFDRNGNLLWSYRTNTYVPSVAISSDGEYIVAGSDKVYFFEKSGKLLWSHEISFSYVDSVAITSDGKYVVAGALDKIYLFNRSGQLLWGYETRGDITSVAISPDGCYVVAGDRDGRIYFFDKNGTLLWSYKTGGYVESIAVSSDGRYVVAGSRDNEVYFFDRSGQLLWSYKTGDSVRSVAITPNGQYVIAGSKDGKVYFFDKSGELLWIYETGGGFYSVAITPDGRYVVAGSGDRKVYFFDKNGKLLWSYKTKRVWVKIAQSVAIASDDKYVYTVAGYENGHIYFFKFFNEEKTIYEQASRPKLTLNIQTDTELIEGEIRYSKLIVKNEGSAPAQNVIVTIFSQGLNIQITESLETLQPQESREIPFYIEAKYFGQYKIFAKAEYTDGLNRYIETTERIITVEALPLLSSNQPGKGDISITLRSDVVKAKVGQEFSVTLSVTNYIVNPDITLQIILKPPSGLSITSTEFVQTGVGEYSAVYHVKSGESKAIKIFLKPNNAGEFVINGVVIYYFDNNKSSYTTVPISQKVIVEDTTQTITPIDNRITKQTPDFTFATVVVSLFIILLGRRLR